MRIVVAGLTLLVALTNVQAQTADEASFCAMLTRGGAVNSYETRGRLFYRTSRAIVELQDGPVARNSIDRLFYYIQVDPSQSGQRSVLNIKFVHTWTTPRRRAQMVDLHNNRWDSKRAALAKSNCAGVTIGGYENFHLNNSPDYCLEYFFHQKAADDFQTMATPQQRQSFAFDDMIEAENNNRLRDFLSGFGPRPARASGARDQSTSPAAHVRSWIKNFTYGSAKDRCIEIRPSFLEGADSVHLRITHHGTNVAATPVAQNWKLTFR